MTPLEKEVKAWADERFGRRSTASRLRKLGEEFGELTEAHALWSQKGIIEEAADCALVLTDMLALMGLSLEEAMKAKLASNKRRTKDYDYMITDLPPGYCIFKGKMISAGEVPESAYSLQLIDRITKEPRGTVGDWVESHRPPVPPPAPKFPPGIENLIP